MRTTDESLNMPSGEESLAETPAEETLEQAAERFDMRAFINGARTGRAKYRLYARADLEAQIQDLQTRAFEASSRGDGTAAARILVQAARVKRGYFNSGMDIVLEERSRAWQVRKMSELREQGITSERELTAYLVAAQIVEPYGVTGQDLLDLAEVIPSQIDGLVKAHAELQKLGESKGLPPF